MQGGHGRALVDEDPDVALGLGERQRLAERGGRARSRRRGVPGEGQQHEDLDDAPGPRPLLGCGEQPVQQPDRPLDRFWSS